MALVLMNEDIQIGAFSFPDRKKPCIAVKKGTVCTIYGHFIDAERATEFMNELASLLGAEEA